jgi:hypothetical protein
MYIYPNVKYLSLLSNPTFIDRFSKNLQIQNFIKICPVGSEGLHIHEEMDVQLDGWINMMNLIITFHYFVNMPKN